MEIQCAPPTTNATERLNEEFCCTIKPQTVFPCAETAPMLLWALLASGQTQMHEVGWLGNVLPSNPVQVIILTTLRIIRYCRKRYCRKNFFYIRDPTSKKT